MAEQPAVSRYFSIFFGVGKKDKLPNFDPEIRILSAICALITRWLHYPLFSAYFLCVKLEHIRVPHHVHLISKYANLILSTIFINELYIYAQRPRASNNNKDHNIHKVKLRKQTLDIDIYSIIK